MTSKLGVQSLGACPTLTVWGVALLVCCSACSTTSSQLKARFARERNCPIDQVGVVDRGGTVYRASGCGDDAEYVCGAFATLGDGSQNCRERGLNPREAVGAPPPKNTSRPDLEAPK